MAPKKVTTKITKATRSGKPRIGVYTGSFDPMTFGHLDVIERASGLFDEVVVAVGAAGGKQPLFTVDERVALIAQVVRRLSNVKVESFDGLAVEFAARRGACALIRGLRSATDYAYEVQMALMNRALDKRVETLFLPTSPEFSHISSSLAKEIALHGGQVGLLVPPLVAKKLAEKVRG